MAKFILSALLVSVLPSVSAAELVRWTDRAGGLAEMDGDNFRWLQLPQGVGADSHKFKYTTTTDWIAFERETINGLDRATPTWIDLDEITPHAAVGANGANWRAVLGEVTRDQAMWTTLAWQADGSLRQNSVRFWYTIDLATGIDLTDSKDSMLFPVPEPSSLVLAALAIGFALSVRRRSR